MLQDVYSIREKIEVQEVFKYEQPTDRFKKQLFYLMKDNLAVREFVKLYKSITLHCGIKRSINETFLENPSTFQDNFIKGFEKLIENQNNINFYLDLIELFLIQYTENKQVILKSINKILLLDSLGYQIDEIKNQIIRIDSSHTYKEIIIPTLVLLNDSKFANIDVEYRKAFEELKNGNYESVLVEANKAFESTMKIICDLKCYGLPNRHTATALIAHLRQNNFIANFQDEKFNGLSKTLESTSITRNNQAGHGQGSVVARNLSLMYAEYALRVSASNILLLSFTTLYHLPKSYFLKIIR